ncbi:hypothetical protein [Enterococcus avium]|uniref:hypothetical protein n=1 Tax=Enterococcus avium TaxID=33945 RepID=UPI00288E276A|nr:hypothetical protein [Enterococcus avium]MDT2485053.1 hypothetical protein [Enterococcus avium]MDT2511639.1 hypothetical protein [Enterococcus avium]
MIEFLKELTKIIQAIHSESYFERNRKKKVIYPYATFNFDTEVIRRNQDGFYLDIDIFDQNDSFLNLLALEDKLKDGLLFKRHLTNELFLVFSFQGSNKVATGDDQLKRRNVRFYVAVDWRKKEYGIA